MVASGQSEIIDRVVAVVNGEAITLSMVEDAMNAIWVMPEELPKTPQEALQKLIDHKLKLQEARKLGAGVIGSAESLSRELAKVVSRFVSPNAVSEALQRRGITQEDLEEKLIEEIMVQEMVNRKFRLFLVVTEGEASSFFEQNKEKFVMPEAVHLSQIFFPIAPGADETAKAEVKKRTSDVFGKLRNGASFSDYTNKDSATDYVTLDQLIPIVAEAISRMVIDEISEPIETPAGYFIVKLNDRRPMRKASFDEVKEDIKKLLLQQKTDTELQNWLERQRELADIRVKG